MVETRIWKLRNGLMMRIVSYSSPLLHHTTPLSRIFRDNLSRIFTRSLKALGEKNIFTPSQTHFGLFSGDVLTVRKRRFALFLRSPPFSGDSSAALPRPSTDEPNAGHEGRPFANIWTRRTQSMGFANSIYGLSGLHIWTSADPYIDSAEPICSPAFAHILTPPQQGKAFSPCQSAGA